MSTPLDIHVLEAAAQWYVDLRESNSAPAQQSAHAQWLTADPRHRQAWARVQRLENTLARVEPVVATPVLNGLRSNRRATLQVLSTLLLAGGSGLLAWKSVPWQPRRADYHTGYGERRNLRLDDGSQLTLDTNSAVDVRYSKQLREIKVLRGQILIETAQDNLARPFIVHTRQGSIRALGTRFLVHSECRETHVDVLQHAVEVRPAEHPEQATRVASGQRLRFSARHAAAPEQAPIHSEAWSKGLLVVSNWRLADFLAELSRYHPGQLRAAPAVADLRISGAFQLADINAVLDNLATTLPVRVRHFTRYWAQLEAR